MTEHWPTTGLTTIQRFRAVAAGIRGAAVTERVVAAEFGDVWAILTDFEGRFTEVQPDMRRTKIIEQEGSHLVLLASSHYGLRAKLVGVNRPGWCWLQSRLLIIGMAAAPERSGGTRVALTGGVRVPHRPAIIPIRVRKESERSLDNLVRLLGH